MLVDIVHTIPSVIEPSLCSHLSDWDMILLTVSLVSSVCNRINLEYQIKVSQGTVYLPQQLQWYSRDLESDIAGMLFLLYFKITSLQMFVLTYVLLVHAILNFVTQRISTTAAYFLQGTVRVVFRIDSCCCFFLAALRSKLLSCNLTAFHSYLTSIIHIC